MQAKQWVASRGVFSYGELPAIYSELPPAVYELQYDDFKGDFILERLFDNFELPDKIYDLEKDLIDRVVKTFNHFNKNFGLLLKGTKGTGKTISAKLISNKLELPVILVNSPFKNMGNFINSIQQDIILFFDEFEKIYEFSRYEDDDNPDDNQNKVSNLLTLMDGVFTSEYKRLFLLTTNKEYLPDAMIARPSRIRYVKDFSDLSQDAILEILKDKVVNKELIPGLVDFIKTLEIITVDIVKSVAEEANLYNTADPAFYEIFNIKRIRNTYDVYEVRTKGRGKNAKTEEVLVLEECDVDRLRVGNNFYDENSDYIGRLRKIDKDKKEITTMMTNETPQRERHFHYRKAISIHRSFLMV